MDFLLHMPYNAIRQRNDMSVSGEHMNPQSVIPLGIRFMLCCRHLREHPLLLPEWVR